MSTDRFAEWDGAYVLGALSSAERLEFEAHLPVCAGCSANVAALAGMPGVLGRLDAGSAEALRDLPAEPSGGMEHSTVAHLARRVHRRRRLVSLAGAAAIVVAALGGAVLGTAAPGPAAADTRLVPVGGSSVSADLTATAVPWGTKLSWACRYPASVGRYATTSYRLVVTTTAGRDTTVATWGANGDGASGLAAATSIPRSSIRTIEIRTGTDDVLARATLAR